MNWQNLTLGQLHRNLGGFRIQLTSDEGRKRPECDVREGLQILASLALDSGNLRVFKDGTIAEFVPTGHPFEGGGVVRVMNSSKSEVVAVYANTDEEGRNLLNQYQAEHGGLQ